MSIEIPKRLRMDVLGKTLFWLLLLPTISCGEAVTDKELDRFAGDVVGKMGCPSVPQSFGSFSVCADSYKVEENIVTINMKWSDKHPQVLPLKEWKSQGKLDTMLRQVVCDAISSGVGVSDNAIFGKEAGLIQKTNIGSRSDEFRRNLQFELASKTRLKIALSDSETDYTLTYWAYDEADQVPRRCSIDATESRVTESGI